MDVVYTNHRLLKMKRREQIVSPFTHNCVIICPYLGFNLRNTVVEIIWHEKRLDKLKITFLSFKYLFGRTIACMLSDEWHLLA